MANNVALVSKARFKLIVIEEFTNDKLRFIDSPIYHPQSHQITIAEIRKQFHTVSIESVCRLNFWQKFAGV
jgi:hypothetical protein